MKTFAFSVLLNFTVASAEECSDHDDTLLLQTRVATQQVKKNRGLSVHRYHINVQEDRVSLLQGAQEPEGEDEDILFRLCANDDLGNGVSEEDEFGAETDSCGPMDVLTEAGETLGSVNGCYPESVSQDDCFDFAETSDWFSSLSANGLTHLPVSPVAAADDSTVFLISIPDMDESKLAKALEEIKKEAEAFPDHRLFFRGSGAKKMRSLLGFKFADMRRNIYLFMKQRRDEARAQQQAEYEERQARRQAQAEERQAQEEERRARRQAIAEARRQAQAQQARGQAIAEQARRKARANEARRQAQAQQARGQAIAEQARRKARAN